eukprot:GHVT01087731.1.p1 GENE.GHVT01087731.1~~GHVT01087731.1.p1  ORF type:complete len:1038 (-),score=42.15 GHVT01087731.1:397-3510(-)
MLMSSMCLPAKLRLCRRSNSVASTRPDSRVPFTSRGRSRSIPSKTGQSSQRGLTPPGSTAAHSRHSDSHTARASMRQKNMTRYTEDTARTRLSAAAGGSTTQQSSTFLSYLTGRRTRVTQGASMAPTQMSASRWSSPTSNLTGKPTTKGFTIRSASRTSAPEGNASPSVIKQTPQKSMSKGWCASRAAGRRDVGEAIAVETDPEYFLRMFDTEAEAGELIPGVTGNNVGIHAFFTVDIGEVKRLPERPKDRKSTARPHATTIKDDFPSSVRLSFRDQQSVEVSFTNANMASEFVDGLHRMRKHVTNYAASNDVGMVPPIMPVPANAVLREEGIDPDQVHGTASLLQQYYRSTWQIIKAVLWRSQPLTAVHFYKPFAKRVERYAALECALLVGMVITSLMLMVDCRIPSVAVGFFSPLCSYYNAARPGVLLTPAPFLAMITVLALASTIITELKFKRFFTKSPINYETSIKEKGLQVLWWRYLSFIVWLLVLACNVGAFTWLIYFHTMMVHLNDPRFTHTVASEAQSTDPLGIGFSNSAGQWFYATAFLFSIRLVVMPIMLFIVWFTAVRSSKTSNSWDWVLAIHTWLLNMWPQLPTPSSWLVPRDPLSDSGDMLAVPLSPFKAYTERLDLGTNMGKVPGVHNQSDYYVDYRDATYAELLHKPLQRPPMKAYTQAYQKPSDVGAATSDGARYHLSDYVVQYPQTLLSGATKSSLGTTRAPVAAYTEPFNRQGGQTVPSLHLSDFYVNNSGIATAAKVGTDSGWNRDHAIPTITVSRASFYSKYASKEQSKTKALGSLLSPESHFNFHKSVTSQVRFLQSPSTQDVQFSGTIGRMTPATKNGPTIYVSPSGLLTTQSRGLLQIPGTSGQTSIGGKATSASPRSTVNKYRGSLLDYALMTGFMPAARIPETDVADLYNDIGTSVSRRAENTTSKAMPQQRMSTHGSRSSARQSHKPPTIGSTPRRAGPSSAISTREDRPRSASVSRAATRNNPTQHSHRETTESKASGRSANRPRSASVVRGDTRSVADPSSAGSHKSRR